jgi:N-acetylglucosaminyl-diphospho-decaprenol L-rhamnosyltransferase
MHEYDLSIIVVAWNVRELLRECFDALRQSDDRLRKQLILVDNGSSDRTADFVRKNYPEVELIESPVNLGFIRANNLAYRRARGEYVLMLNSDAFVSPTALRETVDFMRGHPDAGVVGARLVGRDGVLQPSARFFPTPFRLFLQRLGLDGRLPFVKPLDDLRWAHDRVRRCDWVVGCYLLARKSLVDRSGFFLREDFFMYNDDNDLCKRIKKLGAQVYFYPVKVVHLGGANMKKMHADDEVEARVQELQTESQMIYFRKNYSAFTVFENLLFLTVLDLALIAKRAVSPDPHRTIGEVLRHLRMVYRVTLATRWGDRAVH